MTPIDEPECWRRMRGVRALLRLIQDRGCGPDGEVAYLPFPLGAPAIGAWLDDDEVTHLLCETAVFEYGSSKTVHDLVACGAVAHKRGCLAQASLRYDAAELCWRVVRVNVSWAPGEVG